jgi:hypothetical protein
MARQYQYVGPTHHLAKIESGRQGTVIRSAEDVNAWSRSADEGADHIGLLVVTYIVDVDHNLRIAPRRSEHVVCAGGHPVLAAGEMSFEFTRGGITLVEVSNQSTGYCPEPGCWTEVERALDDANIPHPHNFTTSCTFRRCDHCGQTNIVKDDWFQCGICGSDLPKIWNF